MIRVADTCVECGPCAKACLFGINPPRDAQNGLFSKPDRIHCRRCIDRCPRHRQSPLSPLLVPED